jgi:3-deoxy-D-manno-octulosonic-acid transferase
LSSYVKMNNLEWVVRVAPLDHSVSLKLFLNYFTVKKYFVYESDIWPLTLQCLKQQKVELHWINARVHPSMMHKSKLYKHWVRTTWNHAHISARSLSDQARFKEVYHLDVGLGMDTKLFPLFNHLIPDHGDTLATEGKVVKRGDLHQIRGTKNYTISLISIHREELKYLKSYLSQLNCHQINLIVLPRYLKESKGIHQELRKLPWHELQVIAEFGQVKAALQYSNFAWVGGGLTQKAAMHNIYEVLNSPAKLWVFFSSSNLDVKREFTTHPWEDQLLRLLELQLVNQWGDMSQTSNFNENLTQYRWEIEKQFQKAMEVWNQIHLER